MSIGKRIYELRIKNKLNQEDIAKELFITRQTLSKWEKDESIPDVESIIKLSKIFNVSTDYILNEDYFDTPEGREFAKKEESKYEKLRRRKELTFLMFYDYAIVVINAIAVSLFFLLTVFEIEPVYGFSSMVIFLPSLFLCIVHLLVRMFINHHDYKARALVCELASLLLHIPLLFLYGI